MDERERLHFVKDIFFDIFKHLNQKKNKQNI